MTVSGVADAPVTSTAGPRRTSSASVPTNPVLVRTLAIVGAVVVWEVLARFGVVNELFVSRPTAIVWAGMNLFGSSTAMTAIGQTLTSMVLAFVLGTGLGMVVGITLGLQQLLRRAYLPIVMMLMGIPKSVFLPVFVLLFGLGGTSAVVFGSLLAFVHVTVNVIGGVDLVEPRHLTVARAFRGGTWKRFVHVILPGASPGLFTAIWHGLRNAFVGVVVAELFASTSGIGSLVKIYSNNFQTAEALALVSVISLVVILVGTGWNRLERRLTAWRSEVRT